MNKLTNVNSERGTKLKEMFKANSVAKFTKDLNKFTELEEDYLANLNKAQVELVNLDYINKVGSDAWVS